MTDHNPTRATSRPTDLNPDRLHPSRSPGKPGAAAQLGSDRALRALLAAIAIVLVALMAHLWVSRNGIPALAIYRPDLASPARADSPSATATATPPATVDSPTAMPTPGPIERAAQRIPLLQQSWDARDWQTAAMYLHEIAALAHDYPGLQQARCDTYLNWAQDLERGCQIQQAHALYHQAVSYCPDRETVLGKKALALRYLSGKWHYEHNQWSRAAAALHTVYESDPGYAARCAEPARPGTDARPAQALDARSLLHASYLSAGRELLDRDQIEEAQQAAQAALEINPHSAALDKLLADIRSRLTPAPASSGVGQRVSAQGKRIQVSISQQRMTVWQGDRLLYNWVCSTGGPGSGTATGRFKVQSKIPEAWASQWSLRMPYWLGIYNVGSLENGIHALPIRSNGTILWDGYLGTPVSYGCIILSTENARTLYQWAEIGTPVWIDY